MTLLDTPRELIIVDTSNPAKETQDDNSAPFVNFMDGLLRLENSRTREGRRDDPPSPEDWLATRKVAERFLNEYSGKSPLIPCIQERLNPHRPDNIPCHRLELDNVEYRHNWRDEGADVAAIPYLPPLPYFQHPPERLYEGPIGSEHGFSDINLDDMDKAVFSEFYGRIMNQLFVVATYDEEYSKALQNLRSKYFNNQEEIAARIMVTWAIDSAIPAVDVQRVAKHAGSIEAICGDNSENLEIPSTERLCELVHESKQQLNQLHSDLIEMAEFKIEKTFIDYDERSVELFMKVRSIVDVCRWHIEKNIDLSESQRKIVRKNLAEAYTIYHSILQTCGPVEVDDIRSYVHRDVSILLSGGKVDTELISEDCDSLDLVGEEDYLGAFMAAASYDEVANEYNKKMNNVMAKDLNWHGGARSYFGNFEQSADDTIRQQMALMGILYFRMPKWQRETYKELIHLELQNKLSRVWNAKVNRVGVTEKSILYVPTQDEPVEVASRYDGGFDWTRKTEIYTSQHLMPIMDLIVNHKALMQDPEPRLQIRPGDRSVLGVSGQINKDGVFEPDSNRVAETEEIPQLFTDFLTALSELSKVEPPRGEVNGFFWEEWYKKKLEVIEKFARTRTSETSDLVMPFLEKRLNPLSFEIPPCTVIELPEDFVQNEWEQRADHALIPHLPPLDYLLYPPPNLWDGDNGSASNESVVGNYAGRIIRDEIRRMYGDVAELEPLLGDPDMLMKIYYTWAEDGRIEGIDAHYAEINQQKLQQIFYEGKTDIEYWNLPKTDLAELHLIMPKDLYLDTDRCVSELKELMEGARDHLSEDDNNKFSPSYKSVHKLASRVDNIILAARWHMDHYPNEVPDNMVKEFTMLCDTLESAYLVKNTILQEFNFSGTSAISSMKFHDLSVLIAGYKIDSVGTTVPEDLIMQNYYHDYFDAFMAVANAREVATAHVSMFGTSGDRQKGARAILGSFDAQANSKRQQLALLATIYHRMPQWQRSKYKTIIDSNFEALINEVSVNLQRMIYEDEPLMYIPSASAGIEKVNDMNTVFQFGIKPVINGEVQELTQSQKVSWRQQVYRAQHLFPIDVCLWLSHIPSISKPTKGVEVFHSGAMIRGFGADGHWIDDLGFVHPGYENKRKVVLASTIDNPVIALVEQMGEKQENMWLDNLNEARSVTVESRVGAKMAELIEELLDQDKTNGSIENLSSLGFLLEQLLGCELAEGDSKYLEMLKSLGMLNREAIDISSMGEKEIRDMLVYVKNERPKIEDMDEGSLILLFLGAAGVAPRQELLEQIIKTHETTVNILTLEVVEALESISEKKGFNILKMLGLKPKEIDKKTFLTRRDDLRNYLKQKRKDDPNYKSEVDQEWKEMQLGMIRYIVELVHSTKSYDSSADSTISSVLAARDKGRFLARCSTNGQIVTTMLNLGIPEFKAYFTGDYGPEGNLSIEDFLRHLISAKESGAASHAYSSSNQNENSKTGVVVADGESGKVRLIAPDQIRWRHSSEITYATLADHLGSGGFEERKGVTQSCVNGGSAASSDIAREMGQLDVAESANPDSDVVNRLLLRSDGINLERRAKALRKIMEMYPFMLAMSPKNDYSNHDLMDRLTSAIEVGRGVGNWGAAFFASNIMTNAGFLGKDANEHGKEYLGLLAHRLAVLGQGQFDAVLKNNSQYFIARDLEIISQARLEYLAELAEMMRGSDDPARKVEKNLKKKKRIESNAAFIASKEKATIIQSAILDEDLRNKRADEELYGKAQGGDDKNQYEEAAKQKVAAIIKETIETNVGTFNDKRFQLLSPQAQDALLMAAVTDQNQKLLEESALEERIRAIQVLFVKYSHDHLRLGVDEMGKTLMQIGGSGSSLVTDFEKMAMNLNERFETAIKRNEIPVDVSGFSPREVAARMGRQDMMLLGREKSRSLPSKIQ